ncbi:MAG: dephospho-CoA kinase [Rhodothermia bacterium]|nr:dephospho-CoA kinase [Rhodothermia bacterium]
MRNTEYNNMLVLGVTGGIGSGKSAVCDILEVRGARIFRADEVGKRLMSEDARVRREIVSAFGEGSYLSSGQLNRKYLADRVFSDDTALEQINAIVHPRVFEAFVKAKRDANRDGVRLLVHEAALLFEAGGDRHVDCTVYVDAPRYVRVERVMRRDGVAKEKVMDRMRHQISAAEGRRRADYVLRNNLGREALARRVERLLRTIGKDFVLRDWLLG